MGSRGRLLFGPDSNPAGGRLPDRVGEEARSLATPGAVGRMMFMGQVTSGELVSRPPVGPAPWKAMDRRGVLLPPAYPPAELPATSRGTFHDSPATPPPGRASCADINFLSCANCAGFSGRTRTHGSLPLGAK